MIPYLILLTFVTITAYFGRHYGSIGLQRFTLVFSALMLILFAGLRNHSIGTDTGNYIGWLKVVTSLDSVWSFPIEKGFVFLVLIASQLSDNYAVLLGIIALICVTCYLLTIARLISRYETALFLFITLGSYTFFFNGARQGIAVAICFLALRFLLERKAIPYILLVLFATLFHKTAIIVLPLYYLASNQVGWKQIIAVILSSIMIAISISIFAQFAASFIDEKYATYGQESDGGGLVNTLFLLAQATVFLLFQRQVGTTNLYYPRLLNIYLIGLIPAIASVIGSVNPSGILRLTTYFSHTAILLWPMIFSSFQTRGNRAIASTGFLLFTLAFFILTTITFSNLTPYRLNTELFE